jgi:hypothetical protein
MLNKTRAFITILIFFPAIAAMGQKQVNSPYSRFNLGTLKNAAPFRSLGMGGISTAQRDNTNIYFSNPASYSAFDTTSFIFDFGLDYSIDWLSAGKDNHRSDDMNFDHMMIGFPIAKGVGITAGIMPYSNGYYNISNSVKQGDAGYDPVIGGYTASHAGEGGLSTFYAGAGLKLIDNLSVGVNMNILFGQIKRVNKFVFDDQFNVYHDNSTENIQVNGINFDFGLQYMLNLGKAKSLTAGISFTPSKKYNSDYSNYIFRYTSFGTYDTVSYIGNNAGDTKLPSTIRAGITFARTNKLTAGFDFVATKWSKSEIPGSAGYAADTKNYLLGIEYTPDKYSNFSLIRRIDYRLGGHYGDNYLFIENEQIREIGVTAGFGIPLGRNAYTAGTNPYSKVNFYFDYTRKTGSIANGLHNEDIISIGASLNLYDFWFLKKKFE